jgi:hypothetical protein
MGRFQSGRSRGWETLLGRIPWADFQVKQLEKTRICNTGEAMDQVKTWAVLPLADRTRMTARCRTQKKDDEEEG